MAQFFRPKMPEEQMVGLHHRSIQLRQERQSSLGNSGENHSSVFRIPAP